jgi:hypothetical protein
VIASGKDRESIRRKLEGYELVIYGIKDIIRRELRQTSKKERAGGRSLRILLLRWYDLLVEEHEIALTPKINRLAKEYFEEYKGIRSWNDLENDFLIVAAATINDLDVIVSGDENSMCSGYATEAYRKVNKRNRLKTPKFVDYEKFTRLFNI